LPNKPGEDFLETDQSDTRIACGGHNEYPLAPEKMKVTENMLSPYAKQLLEELEMKSCLPIPSLIPISFNQIHDFSIAVSDMVIQIVLLLISISRVTQ
jgi:hypothetical protein